jgi:hypothetical protein
MRYRKIDAARAFLTVLALAVPMAFASPAVAQGGACPVPASGFRLWDVSTEPYQADDASDVNGDGSVCARATKDTFVQGGQTYTVYLFIDDNARA